MESVDFPSSLFEVVTFFKSKCILRLKFGRGIRCIIPVSRLNFNLPRSRTAIAIRVKEGWDPVMQVQFGNAWDLVGQSPYRYGGCCSCMAPIPPPRVTAAAGSGSTAPAAPAAAATLRRRRRRSHRGHRGPSDTWRNHAAAALASDGKGIRPPWCAPQRGGGASRSNAIVTAVSWAPKRAIHAHMRGAALPWLSVPYTHDSLCTSGSVHGAFWAGRRSRRLLRRGRRVTCTLSSRTAAL